MPMALTSAPRPSLALFTTEPMRAAGDLFGHLLQRTPAVSPTSAPQTVVLFPGLATDGRALWPLRRHLTRLGHNALEWGQGFNTGPQGDIEVWLADLRDRILKQVDTQASIGSSSASTGPAISLVGWSLGGFYARELARLMPDRVSRVITLATPFNGTSEQTHVRRLFKWLNGKDAPQCPQLLKRLSHPPPVPTTAIYSRKDGVVAWQACRHGSHSRADVRDIEVDTSHLGMVFNRRVMGVVSDELALNEPQACGAMAAAG